MTNPSSLSTRSALLRALDLVSRFADEAIKRADRLETEANLARLQLVDCSSERSVLHQQLAKAPTQDPGVMQDDMATLMDVLGLSTHARAISPHEVMVREVIPAAQKVVEQQRCEHDPKMLNALLGIAMAARDVRDASHRSEVFAGPVMVIPTTTYDTLCRALDEGDKVL